MINNSTVRKKITPEVNKEFVEGLLTLVKRYERHYRSKKIK